MFSGIKNTQTKRRDNSKTQKIFFTVSKRNSLFH